MAKTKKGAEAPELRPREQVERQKYFLSGLEGLSYNRETRRIEGGPPKISTNVVKIDKPEKPIRPAVRGPALGTENLGDGAYLAIFGDPGELAKLRKKTEKAQKHRPAAWRALPNGMNIPSSMVLHGCQSPSCGRWSWLREGAEDCPKCWTDGSLRPATAKELAAWMDREKKRADAWKANSAKRRAEVADFNKREAQGSRDYKGDFIRGR